MRFQCTRTPGENRLVSYSTGQSRAVIVHLTCQRVAVRKCPKSAQLTYFPVTPYRLLTLISSSVVEIGRKRLGNAGILTEKSPIP